MGTQVISPRKVARYRRETGLPIVAAYAPAACHHAKLCYLDDGRMFWLEASAKTLEEVEPGFDWRNDEPCRREVDGYLTRYLEKAGKAP